MLQASTQADRLNAAIRLLIKSARSLNSAADYIAGGPDTDYARSLEAEACEIFEIVDQLLQPRVPKVGSK